MFCWYLYFWQVFVYSFLFNSFCFQVSRVWYLFWSCGLKKNESYYFFTRLLYQEFVNRCKELCCHDAANKLESFIDVYCWMDVWIVGFLYCIAFYWKSIDFFSKCLWFIYIKWNIYIKYKWLFNRWCDLYSNYILFQTILLQTKMLYVISWSTVCLRQWCWCVTCGVRSIRSTMYQKIFVDCLPSFLLLKLREKAYISRLLVVSLLCAAELQVGKFIVCYGLFCYIWSKACVEREAVLLVFDSTTFTVNFQEGI